MAYFHLFQDWTAIQAAASQVVTQAGIYWFDAGGYRDLDFHIRTAAVSGSPFFTLEASPSLNDELFKTLTTQAVAANTTYRKLIPYDTASVPNARYVRWKLESATGAAFSATFQLFLGGTLQYGSPFGPAPDAPIVMQDWTTLRIAASTTATQSEPEWMDLQHFQGVEFYVQAGNITGTPSISFQTAPAPDDALFKHLIGTAPTSNSVQRVLVNDATYNPPFVGALSRYARWTATAGGSPAILTFKILTCPKTRGAILQPQSRLPLEKKWHT